MKNVVLKKIVAVDDLSAWEIVDTADTLHAQLNAAEEKNRELESRLGVVTEKSQSLGSENGKLRQTNSELGGTVAKLTCDNAKQKAKYEGEIEKLQAENKALNAQVDLLTKK